MRKSTRKKVMLGLFLGMAAIVAMFILKNQSAPAQASVLDGQTAVVYKSPTCGCCAVYIAYLRKRGVEVEVRDLRDLSEIKDQYQIPLDQTSCHTTLIGGYVVEGHIPAEAIEKLLTEKPGVKGIAMSGMPLGSPGMPGKKFDTFDIYSFVSSTSTELFLSI